MNLENAVLTLKTTGGTTFVINKLVGFKCRKERYTPYSSLDVTVIGGEGISDVVEAKLSIGEKILHRGIMDSLTVTKSGGRTQLRLSSRGFSSMLAQNELAPGLMAGLSLNSLMSEKMIVPNVTWQNSSQTVRYIYVNEHDSQWSAIVSLSLSLNEDYPYIGAVNEVRLFPVNPKTIRPENIFEEGHSGDYSKMVSHYHMKDVNGTYSYNYTDGFATARGIVRHKYIAYDRQFVGLNDYGLLYRLSFTERGCKTKFLTYIGYNGEELRDKVTFPDGSVHEISAVEICGNAKRGIFTKDICYFDKYCNL
ncbi:MAG: hypothetical protein K2N26_02120 [Oscillospiraceae bacterium]|nr:hypothetical protein [Oscillospiraceae bacterium]